MKTLAKTIVLIIAISLSTQVIAQTENSVVVAADQMNVLYIGIDNPVSVAVPGITNDKITVTINNGTITGSNGKYIVKVNEVKETIIEVAAEIKPGVTKKVGSSTFRIKKIPFPTPCVGNYCGTELYISKEELLKDPEVKVSLILPFDYKFEVLSFTFTCDLDGVLRTISVKGTKFNQDIIDIIKKMENNHKLFIENINVKGPDGTTRELFPIIITITEEK